MSAYPIRAPVPTVSVIVPVRDDAERLRCCLASIRANRYEGDIEIIVVDNGSRDDSVGVAREAGAAVLRLPGYRVAALRNAGAQRATGNILAFIDADHAIDETWMTSAVEGLTRPGVVAAGAPCLPPPNANWVQRAYNRLRAHRPGIHDVEWLGSGNMAVRKDAFDTVGGFDASLEACEDVDLCNRLRAAGYRLMSDDRLRSVHFGDPATLRALFFGEMWRGRNNLRTTLRGPLTLRALPSVVVPAADLLSLVAMVCGAVTAPWFGLSLMAYGAVAFATLSLCRAIRMTLGGNPAIYRDVRANFAIAVVYDIARALALVTRSTHSLRKSAGR